MDIYIYMYIYMYEESSIFVVPRNSRDHFRTCCRHCCSNIYATAFFRYRLTTRSANMSGRPCLPLLLFFFVHIQRVAPSALGLNEPVALHSLEARLCGSQGMGGEVKTVNKPSREGMVWDEIGLDASVAVPANCRQWWIATIFDQGPWPKYGRHMETAQSTTITDTFV